MMYHHASSSMRAAEQCAAEQQSIVRSDSIGYLLQRQSSFQLLMGSGNGSGALDLSEPQAPSFLLMEDSCAGADHLLLQQQLLAATNMAPPSWMPPAAGFDQVVPSMAVPTSVLPPLPLSVASPLPAKGGVARRQRPRRRYTEEYADDDSDDEYLPDEAASPASSRSSTGSASPAAAYSTSLRGGHAKRLKPAKFGWTDDVLALPTKLLNQYIREHKLSAAEISDLKKTRRRQKNRSYARNSRARRLQEVEAATAAAAANAAAAAGSFTASSSVASSPLLHQDVDFDPLNC